MGSHLRVANTRNKELVTVKMDSFDRPKELMTILNSIYGSGIQMLVDSDSTMARLMLQYFADHAKLKTVKEWADVKGYKMNEDDVKEEVEYWKWALVELKRAYRQHKKVAVSIG